MKLVCPKNLLFLQRTRLFQDKKLEPLEDHLPITQEPMFYFQHDDYLRLCSSNDLQPIHIFEDMNKEKRVLWSETQFSAESKDSHLVISLDNKHKLLLPHIEHMIHVFFDNVYFLKPNDGLCINGTEKTIIVSSKLYVDNEKHQGVFTVEERFQQTLLQLQSIREKIKDCTIIFIDTSNQINIRYLTDISNLCDHVFLTMSHEWNHYTDDKIIGEIFAILETINRINMFYVKHLVKFGGRYSLSYAFDSNLFFQKDKSTVCIKKQDPLPEMFVIHQRHLQTFLQHIPKQHFDMTTCLQQFLSSIPADECHIVSFLGICGAFSITGCINHL